ncbi:winged helix-turn-helix domain-containing protein [Candidatus Micrarchaeota archaeon]|nr:winged helix-turn-helix domain-containing protein [Candidatus Micrarchaeota archaeon]
MEEIVLDRTSFEALAADTRVKILKSLKERRKTLSELSKELNMSVSGTKEHLETLKKAGLIERIDDGHKWKYYELTKKGKGIIGPKEIKVWILLSISTVALIFSIFSMLSLPSETQLGEASLAKEEMLEGAMAYEEPLANETTVVETTELPTVPLTITIISLICILASLGILLRNRMRSS